jgi:hypothetical protein
VYRYTPATHCAASGGSAMSSDAIKMLLLFNADRQAVDAYGGALRVESS